MNRISVVIPIINESKTIGKVVEDLRVFGYEIIVVDGGSSDGSARIAEKKGAKLIIEKKRGYGRAHKIGIKNTNGEYVAGMDGDMTYSASDIEKLAEVMKKGEIDAVFANRLSKKENYMVLHRKIANKILTLFINIVNSVDIKDSQSGMWLIKKDALVNCLPKSEGMAFSQRIKLNLIKKGYKVSWIDIAYDDRADGSKFNFFKDGIELVLDSLRYRIDK